MIFMVSIEVTSRQLKKTFLNPTVECCCHGNQLPERMKFSIGLDDN